MLCHPLLGELDSVLYRADYMAPSVPVCSSEVRQGQGGCRALQAMPVEPVCGRGVHELLRVLPCIILEDPHMVHWKAVGLIFQFRA